MNKKIKWNIYYFSIIKIKIILYRLNSNSNNVSFSKLLT